jgi:hypothetical protein
VLLCVYLASVYADDMCAAACVCTVRACVYTYCYTLLRAAVIFLLLLLLLLLVLLFVLFSVSSSSARSVFVMLLALSLGDDAFHILTHSAQPKHTCMRYSARSVAVEYSKAFSVHSSYQLHSLCATVVTAAETKRGSFKRQRSYGCVYFMRP